MIPAGLFDQCLGARSEVTRRGGGAAPFFGEREKTEKENETGDVDLNYVQHDSYKSSGASHSALNPNTPRTLYLHLLSF